MAGPWKVLRFLYRLPMFRQNMMMAVAMTEKIMNGFAFTDVGVVSI